MSLNDAMTVAERKKRLLAAKNKINKSAKRNVICFADEAPNPYFLRRPTGIMQLDVDLGGGFPAGGVTYVSGPDNAGKTWLLYRTFAMNQRLYGANSSIAYAPVEGPADYWFMRKCGYKVAIPMMMIEQKQEHRKARGVPLFTKAEIKELSTGIGEFTLIVGASMEETLNQVLYFSQEKLCQIIGVDSVTALTPSAEAQLAMEDFPPQAVHATLMKRFFLHYYPLVSGVNGINETTLMFTNQVTTNRDKTTAPTYMAKYMKDWKPAGAAAAKHGKLIDLVLQSGAKEKETTGGNKVVVGKAVKWELVKGKAGTHDNITGELDFLYEDDVWHSNAKSIVSAGLTHGTILEKNGKMTVIKPDTGEAIPGAENIPNYDTLVGMIRSDPDFEFLVRREVLMAAKVQCTYL